MTEKKYVLPVPEAIEFLETSLRELEERACYRFRDIEKRLQALEGKAPEATSAQEREDTDYKLYEEMARVPDTRRDRRVQKRRFGGGIK